jgi:hypothetical protein
MARYLDALRNSGSTHLGHLQNLQNPHEKGSEGFEGAPGGAFFPKPGLPANSPGPHATPLAPRATVVGTASARWLIHHADRAPIEVTFSPPVDHAGAMAAYPEAAAAQPSPPPAPLAIPSDIAAAFDRCLRAGLYGEDEPALLPALVAADVDATRVLIADMASRIGRCRRCAHFARPGMSDGYCTGRDDLPELYGQMHSLPADLGAGCGDFEKMFE